MPEHASAARDLATHGMRQAAFSDDQEISRSLADMGAQADKFAKTCRSRMLEEMKVSMSAALDYANGLTSTKSPADLRAVSPPRQRGKNSNLAGPERNIATAADVVDDYRAKAFELMKANIHGTLEYAQRLVNVKSPTEFIELSASHACMQFELIIKQTAELGSLAQALTRSNMERMTASFVKVIAEHQE
jgi:hypothetical protein